MPDTLTAGDPKKLFRYHSANLTNAIADNLYNTANGLYAKGLIPQQAKDEALLIGLITNYVKATNLISVLQRQLEASSDQHNFLIKICNIFIEQEGGAQADIAKTILQELGKYI